jgi:hypothetical protein
MWVLNAVQGVCWSLDSRLACCCNTYVCYIVQLSVVVCVQGALEYGLIDER